MWYNPVRSDWHIIKPPPGESDWYGNVEWAALVCNELLADPCSAVSSAADSWCGTPWTMYEQTSTVAESIFQSLEMFKFKLGFIYSNVNFLCVSYMALWGANPKHHKHNIGLLFFWVWSTKGTTCASVQKFKFFGTVLIWEFNAQALAT
jgi:hypothetical protein